MAAMDFPSSPTNGQVYGNYVYSTAKGAWQASPTPQSVAVSSPTAPSNPKNDTLWYNTQDGNTYIYFNDGNTSQWVQIKSDATLSSTLGNRVTTLETYPSGLVPIVPSSVTVGSGTGSVNSLGVVSFSGATSITLDNIFTSNFRNYKMIVNMESFSANNDFFGRMTAGGVESSTSNYHFAGSATNTAGTTGAWVNPSAGQFHFSQNSSAYGVRNRLFVEMFDPAIAKPTNLFWSSMHDNGTTWTATTVGGTQSLSNAYDGFKLYVSAGNMTGTMKIYGYR